MAIQILGILSLILTCAVGIWKFFARLKSEKRKLADEAKKDIEKATSEDGSASDLLDGFGRL